MISHKQLLIPFLVLLILVPQTIPRPIQTETLHVSELNLHAEYSFTVNSPEFTVTVRCKADRYDNYYEFDKDRILVVVSVNNLELWEIQVKQVTTQLTGEQGVGSKPVGHLFYTFSLGVVHEFHLTFSCNESKTYYIVPKEDDPTKHRTRVKADFPLEDPPFNVTVSVDWQSGNTGWDVTIDSSNVFEETTSGFWAGFINVLSSIYNWFLDRLPSPVADFIRTAGNVLATAYAIARDTLPYIAMTGLSCYGLFWIFLIIRAIRDLDPSPIIDHIHAVANFGIWVWNLVANLVKAIISFFKPT